MTSPTHSISVTPKEGNRLDVGLSEEKAPSGDLVIPLKQASPMGHVPKEMMEGGGKEERLQPNYKLIKYNNIHAK